MSRETAAAREGRLPGERPDQPTVEDALHWVVVYKDLSTAVRNLLASSDLEDRAKLEAMLEGFERRRRWWRRRI
ncbi:MAG TPA: hypothetical protein VF160_18160 [Candidatus Dormibacteraeota bacterium]